MTSPGTFDQLVFSGGGTRCFWQGGFLEVVSQPLRLDPERIATVSGGALAGCCYVAGTGQRLLEVMGEAFDRQQHNVDLSTNGDLAPHQDIYRDVVETTLDRQAVQAVADGPPLQITLARPPARLPLKAGALMALTLYLIDQTVRSSPHMALPVTIGTKQLVVDARQAARDGTLVDLVCAAAVIPPVFDPPRWPPGNGDRVMDSGTVDNAPMPQPDEGRALILLTRRYRNVPERADRLYVAPSRETPADKIDFTSREKIELTWQAGVADGEAFLKVNPQPASGGADG